MIIVCGGIKGGTGKTTLATTIASYLCLKQKKVLLVDADEQQSAADWAEVRIMQNLMISPTTISLFGSNIDKQLSRMISDYHDIIIDVGGRDTKSQRSALMLANIFIIPYKPRSLDIWTVSKVTALILEYRIVNPHMKPFFLVNQADSNGSDNTDVMKILTDSGVTCIPHMIGNRKSFCHAASQGLSIFELKKKDKIAIKEFEDVYEFIFPSK